MVDGRLARGERTRANVLDAAVRLASVEGLGGLSLSQLAQRLPVSKSALFAHWASRRSSSSPPSSTPASSSATWSCAPRWPTPGGPAAVRRARVAPALLRRRRTPRGCFFVGAQYEYDAREGPCTTACVKCPPSG
ncbi:TetR/AcrR family transcriptional regulator [Luedemannella flava]